MQASFSNRNSTMERPMDDLATRGILEKLRDESLRHTGPELTSASDPIADTPMMVTLNQLSPYSLNPRIMRNPRYDDIKASIQQRGLDAPPVITRRPGDPHFTIRNGGNTRLSILKELWAETRDERYFRIPCLFRPWCARGEIVALTGHLAENELHGGLTFIERALGVEKARKLYEQESGDFLSQTELAQRLTADGYPLTQPHISRMQDAVEHLLPAIPTLLYAGLGKPQIERLIALRKAASRSWDRCAAEGKFGTDFDTFFQEILSSFDGTGLAKFMVQLVQDELVRQLSATTGMDIKALALDLLNVDSRQAVRSATPPEKASTGATASALASARTVNIKPETPAAVESCTSSPPPPMAASTKATIKTPPPTAVQLDERIQAHVVSPVETTERLEDIRRKIADATGERLEDFRDNAVRAIPVQAGGLYPISDVWYIESALDEPFALRRHIAQLALEIADEANLTHRIDEIDDGMGFRCDSSSSSRHEPPLSSFEQSVLELLDALSGDCASAGRNSTTSRPPALRLGILLLGAARSHQSAAPVPPRLSDQAIVKLFRLIRLTRRLVDLDSAKY
jgi:ParB family protein of integrating conjugative element (PFGI_1 class)